MINRQLTAVPRPMGRQLNLNATRSLLLFFRFLRFSSFSFSFPLFSHFLPLFPLFVLFFILSLISFLFLFLSFNSLSPSPIYVSLRVLIWLYFSSRSPFFIPPFMIFTRLPLFLTSPFRSIKHKKHLFQQIFENAKIAQFFPLIFSASFFHTLCTFFKTISDFLTLYLLHFHFRGIFASHHLYPLLWCNASQFCFFICLFLLLLFVFLLIPDRKVWIPSVWNEE